jgi:hypothetical protein
VTWPHQLMHHRRWFYGPSRHSLHQLAPPGTGPFVALQHVPLLRPRHASLTLTGGQEGASRYALRSFSSMNVYRKTPWQGVLGFGYALFFAHQVGGHIFRRKAQKGQLCKVANRVCCGCATQFMTHFRTPLGCPVTTQQPSFATLLH